jgi:ArsR family transcriptional regulator
MSGEAKMSPSDSVSFCRCLADDTRQAILQLLQKKGELRVNDIVAAFQKTTQPTISHHLAILKHEGLVNARREGKEILYSLNAENLEECCGMLFARFVPAKSVAPTRKRRTAR